MAVLVLVYLIVEIAAVVSVMSAIGLLWTIVALIAGALLGGWLTRREGGKALRAVLAAAGAGRAPVREISDGMLIGLGGVLIAVPGFVSDVLGLLVLLPPVRALLRRGLERRMARSVGNSMRMATGRFTSGMVVDGEVVDGGVVDGGVVDGGVVREDRSHPVIEQR